jgi:hypothetical protein
MAKTHHGGCLCGAIRFTAKGDPFSVSHCHCSLCRKATGGVVGTYAGFLMKDVRLAKGQIKYFRSSAWLERGFCPRCGSSLSSRDPVDPQRIWFTIGALDAPAKTKPVRHIFAPDRVKWLRLDEGLPRHKTRPRATVTGARRKASRSPAARG